MPDTTEEAPALRQSDDSGDINPNLAIFTEPAFQELADLTAADVAEIKRTLVAVDAFRKAMTVADADPTLNGSAARAMLAVGKLCNDLELPIGVMNRILLDIGGITDGKGTSLWVPIDGYKPPSSKKASYQSFYGMVAYVVSSLQDQRIPGQPRILEDDACDVVVEAMSGLEGAYKLNEWNRNAVKGITQRVVGGAGPELGVNILAELRKTPPCCEHSKAGLKAWLRSEWAELAPMHLAEKKRATKPAPRVDKRKNRDRRRKR